jgi:hydrogenase nickel incorporation protein HypA/HybF
MHETDMTRALIQTLRDWWQSQPGQPQIARVHLVVGQFTCVEPASLTFAYAAQTQGTFLQGSQLVIRKRRSLPIAIPAAKSTSQR